MKGFSGDDIFLGHGSFEKFIGGLGYDWGSYELATQGVDEDMNRKEFVAANGAVDTIRDVWQHTEGGSGSAYDDRILGTNDTKLIVTKDELDNVNLITGLQSFFDPGIVSFGGGNILLGGGGNDTLIGGGGDDVIDGDAWLHVGLTSYSAGGTILREIKYDPNAYTAAGLHNYANVDTAVYNDIMDNYDMFPGFLDGKNSSRCRTRQSPAAAVVAVVAVVVARSRLTTASTGSGTSSDFSSRIRQPG